MLKTITAADMTKFVMAMKKGATSPDGIVQSPGSCARIIRELYFGMNCLGITPPTHGKKISDLVGKLNDEGTGKLGRAQFAKLLAHTNPRWREHLIAYRLTGVRKSELYLIEARHVSLGEDMLTVPGANSVNGDSGRAIPIHEQLRPILARRMKFATTGPLFEDWANADRDLRDAGIRAVVGPVSFNVLKASFGEEMLRAGVSTREVAEFYGHTTTRMVEGAYNKLKAGKHLKGALQLVKAVRADKNATEDT